MTHHAVRAPENDVEYEELWNAAEEGNLERLEAALLPSMNINALDADILQGRAAIHIAAEVNNVPAIQWLLAHGAEVDLRNAEGETPLHEAAFLMQLEAVKALLQAGADINLQTGEDNNTPLHNVLKYKPSVTPKEIEAIVFLLDQGADINANVDHWGTTLINEAINLRSDELVELLIDRGARVEDSLFLATYDHRMVQLLLSRGAKIVSSKGANWRGDRESAITSGAGSYDVDVLQTLLAHSSQADLDESQAALNWAASGGRVDIARLLIEHGFDVNAVTEDCFVGRTPLLAACWPGEPSEQRVAIAKLLIEHGADVNARDRSGTTTAAEMLLREDSISADIELQQLIRARVSSS